MKLKQTGGAMRGIAGPAYTMTKCQTCGTLRRNGHCPTCANSTAIRECGPTHHSGCACHESRQAATIRDLESRLAAALAANAKQAAKSRAVEMMAQIGALVNRAEQAECERDELRGKLARVRAAAIEWQDVRPNPAIGVSTMAIHSANAINKVGAAILAILDGKESSK